MGPHGFSYQHNFGPFANGADTIKASIAGAALHSKLRASDGISAPNDFAAASESDDTSQSTDTKSNAAAAAAVMTSAMTSVTTSGSGGAATFKQPYDSTSATSTEPKLRTVEDLTLLQTRHAVVHVPNALLPYSKRYAEFAARNGGADLKRAREKANLAFGEAGAERYHPTLPLQPPPQVTSFADSKQSQSQPQHQQRRTVPLLLFAHGSMGTGWNHCLFRTGWPELSNRPTHGMIVVFTQGLGEIVSTPDRVRTCLSFGATGWEQELPYADLLYYRAILSSVPNDFQSTPISTPSIGALSAAQTQFESLIDFERVYSMGQSYGGLFQSVLATVWGGRVFAGIASFCGGLFGNKFDPAKVPNPLSTAESALHPTPLAIFTGSKDFYCESSQRCRDAFSKVKGWGNGDGDSDGDGCAGVRYIEIAGWAHIYPAGPHEIDIWDWISDSTRNGGSGGRRPTQTAKHRLIFTVPSANEISSAAGVTSGGGGGGVVSSK